MCEIKCKDIRHCRGIILQHPVNRQLEQVCQLRGADYLHLPPFAFLHASGIINRCIAAIGTIKYRKSESTLCITANCIRETCPLELYNATSVDCINRFTTSQQLAESSPLRLHAFSARRLSFAYPSHQPRLSGALCY